MDPLRTHPNSGLSARDPYSSQNQTDLASVVKQIENLDGYVATLEGKLVTRIEVCEGDVAMASNQAVGLATQCNEVTRNLSAAIQQVHKVKMTNLKIRIAQKRSFMIQRSSQHYWYRL